MGGGLLGGIGQVLGDIGAHKSASSAAKQINSFEKQKLEKMLGFIGAEGGAAKANLRESIGGFRKVGQDSRANLAKIADNRVRLLKEQEGQDVQAAQTAAFRQGGAAGNKRGLASRGARSDSTRAMLQLDELFNNSFNALGAQEAGNVGGVQQGLAQVGLDIMKQKVAAQAGQQNAVKPSAGAGALSSAGNLLGGAAGAKGAKGAKGAGGVASQQTGVGQTYGSGGQGEGFGGL